MCGEKVKEGKLQRSRKEKLEATAQSKQLQVSNKGPGSGGTKAVKKIFLEETGFERSPQGKSKESKYLRLTSWAKARGSTVPKRLQEK